MAINHLADRTNTELRMLRGFRRTMHYAGTLGQPFNKAQFASAPLPDNKDWRLYGTSFKNLLVLLSDSPFTALALSVRRLAGL